jgi:hypothetical protein
MYNKTCPKLFYLVKVADQGAYPWPNPTVLSYNASVVKIYNTTGNPMRFENKYIFFR